jgi:hypothetical protein
MVIDFSNLKLRQDIDRINVLQWAHFFLIVFSVVIEMSNGIIGTLGLFKLVLLSLIYKYFFKTVKNLNYSYWTFATLTALYLISSMYFVSYYNEIWGLMNIYFLTLILLGVQVYILSSPIYYPRVSWWEYDFRYRDDQKVKVKSPEKEYECRLSDLRRSAGCLQSFEIFKNSEKLELIIGKDGEDKSFNIEIMSSRQYSLGRPRSYGIKFLFSNDNEKDIFMRICEDLKDQKKFKTQQRFTKNA